MSGLAGRGRVVVALVAGVALTAGCRTTAGSSAHPGTDGARPTASTPAAVLTFEPADQASRVRLDQRVAVHVSDGRLTGVTATRTGGAVLTGSMAGDGSGWLSTEALAPGSSYTVVATAVDAAGHAVTAQSQFGTLTPTSSLRATIQPENGQTVGVGMPVIVSFNRSVTDRAGVEHALAVTATPPVTGAWHWMSSREMQWRPEEFWPSGTSVSVTAALAGVHAGPGLWGSADSSASFAVGRAQISTVDVTQHTLTVRRNGVVIRTIPVTTGRAGPKTATRDGIKVIITRETSRRMDAATTGVDPKDPNYYNIVVRYAMRLTWSGEFLHAAPWSVGSQGHANVSHGCTGMSTANAKWMFDHSRIGDVVIYTHSSRPLEWGNGYTAWNMPWGTWSTPTT